MAASARASILAAIVAALALFGAALQVRELLRCRGLWLDESMLANNFVERGFLGLLEPLEKEQYAPIGYLWLVEAVSRLLGDGETALRSPAFAAGLATLAVMLAVARRSLQPEGMGEGFPLPRRGFGWAGAIAAVGFTALAPATIYYAAEVKPYALDALVSIALFLVLAPRDGAGTDAPAEGPSTARAVIAGLLAQLVSFPAVFALAGLGGARIITAWRAGRRAEALRWVAISAAWLALFAVLFAAFARRGTSSEFMNRFWAGRFAPLPTSVEAILWYPRSISRVGRDNFGLPFGGWAVVSLAAVGLVSLARDRRAMALPLALTGACVLAASLAHKYPIENRTVHFATPLLALAAAAGVEAIGRAASLGRSACGWRGTGRGFPSPGRSCGWRGTGRGFPSPGGGPIGAAAAVAAIVVLLVAPAARDAELTRVHARADVVPILRDLKPRLSPTDTVVVYGGAVQQTRYYFQRMGLRCLEVIPCHWSRDVWSNFMIRAAEAIGRPRVWVVYANVRDTARGSQADQLAFYRAYFTANGKALSRIEKAGAILECYDLRGPPRDAPVPASGTAVPPSDPPR